MQYLPLPCSDAEDDAVVQKLCEGEPWLPHEVDWLAAYSAYRHAQSDPWAVTPATFVPDIAEGQRDLYENRKRGGPIRRIRRTPDLLSCPVCGSPTTGSLDHLLPRAAYPEFSIMRANLVPACVHCNSASKGDRHRGDVAPERFIHPYYDQFADQALWSVRINPPYAAATFDALPLDGLLEPILTIVRYHLSHVLGDEFTRRMETLWSTFPASIRTALNGRALTSASVSDQINIDLARAAVTRGKNGWETAFLRGLSANPAAIANVVERTVAYPV